MNLRKNSHITPQNQENKLQRDWTSDGMNLRKNSHITPQNQENKLQRDWTSDGMNLRKTSHITPQNQENKLQRDWTSDGMNLRKNSHITPQNQENKLQRDWTSDGMNLRKNSHILWYSIDFIFSYFSLSFTVKMLWYNDYCTKTIHMYIIYLLSIAVVRIWKMKYENVIPQIRMQLNKS